MLDLVLPLECGSCGARSTRWCASCAREMSVRPDEPHLVSSRVDPGVPVFSLGRYAGARRQAIVALKEHGRGDLVAPLADALRVGLARMVTWGVVGAPLATNSRSSQSMTSIDRTSRAQGCSAIVTRSNFARRLAHLALVNTAEVGKDKPVEVGKDVF